MENMWEKDEVFAMIFHERTATKVCEIEKAPHIHGALK